MANSVDYEARSKNVPANVVQTLVADLANQLEGLGDSFTTERWADDPLMKFEESVARESSEFPNKPDSLLLFYYFGQGIRSASNDLLLFCKDRDWQDERSMVKLSDIVSS